MRYHNKDLNDWIEKSAREEIRVPDKPLDGRPPIIFSDELTECSFRLRWYRERLPFAHRAGFTEEVDRINRWIPILEARQTLAIRMIRDGRSALSPS